MNWPNTIRLVLALSSIGALAYFALRFRLRQRHGGTKGAGPDFRPTIGFTGLDGWASLAVLLENRCDSNVWAEEIEIALADLIADAQTSEACCHQIHKIHQTVQPQDMLPVSLVEAIYEAAGKPQRKYSCTMSAIVRYRVGEKWFEKPVPTYTLKMAGLTVVSNRREKRVRDHFRPQNKIPDPQTLEIKSK